MLRAADPDISEVLQRVREKPFSENISMCCQATFVSAYAINSDHQWDRADIEGAFYIVKRSTDPL